MKHTDELLHWLKEAEHYLISKALLSGMATDGELWLQQHITEAIAKAEEG